MCPKGNSPNLYIEVQELEVQEQKKQIWVDLIHPFTLIGLLIQLKMLYVLCSSTLVLFVI